MVAGSSAGERSASSVAQQNGSFQLLERALGARSGRPPSNATRGSCGARLTSTFFTCRSSLVAAARFFTSAGRFYFRKTYGYALFCCAIVDLDVFVNMQIRLFEQLVLGARAQSSI